MVRSALRDSAEWMAKCFLTIPCDIFYIFAMHDLHSFLIGLLWDEFLSLITFPQSMRVASL